MPTKTTIKCPNCHTDIDVNDILYHQLEDELKQKNIAEETKIKEESAKKDKEYKEALKALKDKENSINEQKERFDEKLAKATKEKIKIERQKLNDTLRKEILDEQSESMADLQKELEVKSNQVKELNKSKVEIERLKREKSETEDKIKADIESNFNNKLDEEKKKFKLEQDKLKLEESKKTDEIERLKKEQENLKAETEKEFEKILLEKLKEEKEKTEKETKDKISNETKDQLDDLKKELEEKSYQVKDLNKSKAEIEKLKREKDEIESKVKAESELALTEKLKVEKENIKKQSDEQNELKLKQKEEQLKQLQEQLQIAQRKAEQGSMQLQGEVQELAIEEYLTNKFPFDMIEEIKKGARGADCIQIIHTREIQNCGKIYYESKRTKDFQKTWIEKFKADMREKSVDVGVLVTEILPSELDRMGLMDGIWICTFDEFKGLSAVLRESIIKINHAKKSEENKTDKMSLLYGYLTSTEFRMQIEAIVEGFTTMQGDLDTEKRSMARIWKQREKQITKVLDNTIGMYGSIKGIAGNAIGNVQSLELPYSDLEEDEN